LGQAFIALAVFTVAPLFGQMGGDAVAILSLEAWNPGDFAILDQVTD